jgi:hypothetical protein
MHVHDPIEKFGLIAADAETNCKRRSISFHRLYPDRNGKAQRRRTLALADRCPQVHRRRLDELFPWRYAAASVKLECEERSQ